MKRLIVETGSGTAVMARPRLSALALPWSHASTATKLHWIFRFAVAMEFVGHGAFGIIGKEAWVPYITVFGFSESAAWQLMPLVGAVDIGLGLLTLYRPMPAVLAHMTFWGLMTASLRPVAGEPVWELLERGGNYAVPLAFLLLSGGGGRALKGWLAQVKSSPLERASVQRIAWVLRAGTAALLIGHGGFGAFMHKEEWFGYFAAVGIGPGIVKAGHLISVVGWFEIALGVAVLFKPARNLLLFVVTWKLGTEFLRYSAGEPMWEFIERGGSYAAPLALLFATTWLRRENALTANPESAGPRNAGVRRLNERVANVVFSIVRCSSGLMIKALLTVITALYVFVTSTPAAAMIGGASDGTGHPFVGAIDARPLGLRLPVASGVLISPTVYLTTAHGTRRFDDAGLTHARVTFDPVVSSSSTWYTGTIHTNPAYDPSITSVSNTGDPGDLAVIVFDRPVTGITPASLPTEGLLDRLGPHGLSGTSFDVVGYGVSSHLGGPDGGGKRRPDFSSSGMRRLTHANFASLSPGMLRLRTNGGSEICIGDSGSPSLFGGSNVVAGITLFDWSLSGGQCESGPWNQRVDTPSARAFLGQYVTLP